MSRCYFISYYKLTESSESGQPLNRPNHAHTHNTYTPSIVASTPDCSRGSSECGAWVLAIKRGRSLCWWFRKAVPNQNDEFVRPSDTDQTKAQLTVLLGNADRSYSQPHPKPTPERDALRTAMRRRRRRRVWRYVIQESYLDLCCSVPPFTERLTKSTCP